jgi:hypothetical protein
MEALEVIKQVCSRAGLTPELVRDHLEVVDRSNAGGRVWENGQAKDDKHAVLFQFIGTTLPGDIEVYMYPIVDGQPYRHTTVNRGSLQFLSTVMSPEVFLEAVGVELRALAEMHGLAYCSSESCSAMTPAAAGVCRVCGAPLEEADDDYDGGDDDDKEPEEPAAAASAVTKPTLVPSGPPAAVSSLP